MAQPEILIKFPFRDWNINS